MKLLLLGLLGGLIGAILGGVLVCRVASRAAPLRPPRPLDSALDLPPEALRALGRRLDALRDWSGVQLEESACIVHSLHRLADLLERRP